MEIKAVFGILSTIFTLIGAVSYLKSIYKKEINPQILSWFGWAFITLIGAVAMYTSGSRWSVLFIFSNSLSCFSIAIYSIYKKIGVWSTTIYDYVFFILGILGIILWQIFNNPLIAILLSVLADFCFAIPTLIKVYKNPRSEKAKNWIPYCVAGLFGLLALGSFSLSEILYPVYIFTINLFILLPVVANAFYLSKNKVK